MKKKIILVESTLKEDDAVFNLDETVIFPPGIWSATTASEQLEDEIKDWDITDKTDAFKAWIKQVEADIIKWKYNVRGMDISEFENEFLTEVLGFHPHGPEVHYNLADYGVELKFKKEINNTSGVIPPIPESPSQERRFHKHIVHQTMPPAILIGWSKLYIKRIASLLVVQLLMDGVAAETIIDSMDHLWLFEHIDTVENITKLMRKLSLEYKYSKNHKQFDKVKEIKDKLREMLADIEWEMICRHEYSSQKNIVRGSGLSQALLDWLDEGDLEINSFKIIGGDL